MSRTWRRPQWADDKPLGLRARFQADCDRCPDQILVGDLIVITGGRTMHRRCQSGADDE